MTRKLEALLFDVDGTLADTERDGHRIAFNHAFDAAGLDWIWTIPLYGDLLAVSGGKERLKFYIDRYQAGFEPPQGLDRSIRELHALKQRYYLELMKDGKIPLRPGVERLLREARKTGLRLALVTTTTQENVESLLEQNLGQDSRQWFDVIAAGDVVASKKPAPDIYYCAMNKLDLPASACLAIEDSDNGMEAATAAGVKTLVTGTEYTRKQDFSKAAIVLDQLGEPGAGFTVLAGDAGGYPYANVEFLNWLFHKQPD
jgi:HAD superfamily hydrolase (TIGR01509 family)